MRASDTTAWHRLSPRMLLVHPIIEVGRALPALIGLIFAGHAHGHGSLFALAGAAAVTLYALTRWFTTRLRITPQQVQLRHGLVLRRTRSTSRDRIRTVDLTAHPLHRLLGLTRVAIGTGTSDRKGAGRLLIDGLPGAVAGRLRDELLRHEPADMAAEPIAPRVLARLEPRWIGYGPFTLSGVITGAVLFGLYWRVQGESGVNLLHHGPLRRAGDRLDQLSTGTMVLLVLGGTLVFVAVASTVGYVLAFWNFRLTRHADGTVQVTRGLLTTRATSIERRRLVGVQVSEPLPLRVAGGMRTLAIATGLRVGRGGERGGEVLLPPAPRASARRVAALVLDDSPAVTVPLRVHGARARRRRVARALAGGLLGLAATLLAVVLGAPAWLAAIGLALVAGAVPLGLDRYRSLGHAIADGYLVTRWGTLIRRRAHLDGTAVIGWTLRRTWFQRRAGLLTLTATTAAGRQAYRVADLTPAAALSVVEDVTPGLLSPFRQDLRAAPPATSSSTARPSVPATSPAAPPAPLR